MRKTLIMSLAIVGSLLLQAYTLTAVLAAVTTAGMIMERFLNAPTNKPLQDPVSLFVSLYRKLRKPSTI